MFLQKVAENRDIHNLIMSDEAISILRDFSINTSRIWATENATMSHQSELHPFKCTVWCGVSLFYIYFLMQLVLQLPMLFITIPCWKFLWSAVAIHHKWGFNKMKRQSMRRHCDSFVPRGFKPRVDERGEEVGIYPSSEVEMAKTIQILKSD